MNGRKPKKEPSRHTVTVEIAGERHVLRSDVPPEYTRAVAAHVDQTIQSLPGFGTLEPVRAATLAALSITDELFRARLEIDRLRDQIERRTMELTSLLETAEAASRRAPRPPAPAKKPAPEAAGEPEL